MSKGEGKRLLTQGSLAAGARGRGRPPTQAYLSWLIQDRHPSLLEIEEIWLEGKGQNRGLLSRSDPQKGFSCQGVDGKSSVAE